MDDIRRTLIAYAGREAGQDAVIKVILGALASAQDDPMSWLANARVEAEALVKNAKVSVEVTDEESILGMNVSLVEVADLFDFFVRRRPDIPLD
jgi:hypothetical protein